MDRVVSVRAAAIILGRAGSKGVANKNMRLIAGRPCAAWTIDHALAAQAAGAVAHVAVSTDSPELATLARQMGAHAIARPPDLASDTARVDDAACHALEALRQHIDEPVEAVVILYANVPVRPARLIERSVALLSGSGADSVQSYAPVGKHHPWWTAVVSPAEAGGRIRPWEGDVLNHGVFRRQDLPPAHIPDGGVLTVTVRALELHIPGVPPGPHAFFGLDRRGIINPEGAVVDIDSEIDVLVADALLRGAGARAR